MIEELSTLLVLSLALVRNIDKIIISVHVLAISCILLAKLVTPLNRLLLYGKNLKNVYRPIHNENLITNLTNIVVNFTVPKSFFLHFYIIYALSIVVSIISLLYLPIYLENLKPNSFYQLLLQDLTNKKLSYDEYKNLHIILTLISIQSIRRLFESIFVTKFSPSSKINISHYLVGHSFYILITLTTFLGLLPYYFEGYKYSLIVPTTLDKVLVMIFLILSFAQFRCHLLLSKLVKYSVPDFKLVSCPHYFLEILLYLIVLIFSLKLGRVSSIQLQYLIAWLFVLVNLSTSALDSYNYYSSKYREDFKLKWAIIPYIL